MIIKTLPVYDTLKQSCVTGSGVERYNADMINQIKFFKYLYRFKLVEPCSRKNSRCSKEMISTISTDKHADPAIRSIAMILN